MSGLSPVPRIPKRASTMNGSEASRSAAHAIGRPLPRAARSPSARATTTTAQAAATSPSAIAAVVASPGSRTVHQASGQSAASPTAGARRDQRRRPQAIIIACPTSAAAPRMSRNEP